MPFVVTVQADDSVAAIAHGPLTCATSRHEPIPLIFHWRRGLCEDVVLQLDPANPAITEEAVDGNLIGPALHVPALVKARAPIFSTAAGNAKLPPTETPELCVCCPSSTETLRGEYRSFLLIIGNEGLGTGD
ncbi:MAG: hypothetical protein R2873_02155 [Caldilineaceae bacterium]